MQAHKGSGLKTDQRTEEEDHKLKRYMKGHDNKRRGFFPEIPKLVGLKRCWKSCWRRWREHLRHEIKKGNFSQEENNAIISLSKLFLATSNENLSPRTFCSSFNSIMKIHIISGDSLEFSGG